MQPEPFELVTPRDVRLPRGSRLPRQLEKLNRDLRKEARCSSGQMELWGDTLFTCKVGNLLAEERSIQGHAARVLCPVRARQANSNGISLVAAEFWSIPRKTHEARAHAAGTELGGVRMLWERCLGRRGRGSPGGGGELPGRRTSPTPAPTNPSG